MAQGVVHITFLGVHRVKYGGKKIKNKVNTINGRLSSNRENTPQTIIIEKRKIRIKMYKLYTDILYRFIFAFKRTNASKLMGYL